MKEAALDCTDGMENRVERKTFSLRSGTTASSSEAVSMRSPSAPRISSGGLSRCRAECSKWRGELGEVASDPPIAITFPDLECTQIFFVKAIESLAGEGVLGTRSGQLHQAFDPADPTSTLLHQREELDEVEKGASQSRASFRRWRAFEQHDDQRLRTLFTNPINEMGVTQTQAPTNRRKAKKRAGLINFGVQALVFQPRSEGVGMHAARTGWYLDLNDARLVFKVEATFGLPFGKRTLPSSISSSSMHCL